MNDITNFYTVHHLTDSHGQVFTDNITHTPKRESEVITHNLAVLPTDIKSLHVSDNRRNGHIFITLQILPPILCPTLSQNNNANTKLARRVIS